MRSRVIGGIAVVLGIFGLVAVFLEVGPINIKALLGGLLLVGFGGYYLWTGKKAATMKEFIVGGKVSHDGKPDKS